MTPFEKVLEFHKKMELDINSPLTYEKLNFRTDLIYEEFVEVMDEVMPSLLQEKFLRSSEINLLKLTKELADLMYVIIGTAITFGLPLELVFNRVHESNMSKLGNDGKPIYREDGKVIKGPNYQPPKLEDLFDD